MEKPCYSWEQHEETIVTVGDNMEKPCYSWEQREETIVTVGDNMEKQLLQLGTT